MSHACAAPRPISVCKLSVVFAGGRSARDSSSPNPAAVVKSLRVTKRRRPTGLTEPEVHGLLRVAGESKRGRAKRDYGLLQLLLQTSLRVGELTSLKLGDVQIRDRSGEVRVREGKGKKEREVPLNASARPHRGQNRRNPGPSPRQSGRCHRSECSSYCACGADERLFKIDVNFSNTL
jgi:integrase